MAYTIPVLTLLIDKKDAALALNLDPDFFENERSERHERIDDLINLTSAPLATFSDEGGEFFYIGIRIASGFELEITPKLLAEEAILKAQYAHPLIQAAKLHVVSDFC